ncbi:MAG: hypothetical protein LBD45_02965 [Bacteroidales bacterium]|jgi:hypothetical protein|nr:hypothetical protein [Bacteroidales bacterium]
MRKFTFFAAAWLLAAGAWAQINNPVGADGYYIVKWDCATDNWAASNDFEIDEAITFAIDVTGTALEDWLKGTPEVTGATRGIAINKWSGFGDFNGDSNRLKQIKGNIYGATYAFSQLANTFDLGLATAAEAVTHFRGTVFGFEYTATELGAKWYVNPIDLHTEEKSFFVTLPYTGTKTSVEFYSDDYTAVGFWNMAVGGYAPSCAEIASAAGVFSLSADSSVAGYEYHNLQGIKLTKAPEKGLYIETSILSNGNRVHAKVIK